MKLTALLALSVLVTGCASPPVSFMDPAAVQIMPNDCANRTATLRWLETQAAIARHPLETERQYEQNRAVIKKRLWTVRYNCQPV
jgi:hypothetical protein